MAFPPDACSLIVKYVADSRPTLVSLCTVSKQFQIPAEKALYNTLHLRGYNTVTVCGVLRSTPRVATLVVAISVYGQEEVSDESSDESDNSERFEPSDEYWDVLRDALRRTTRLRFLNLYFGGGGETNQAWVLDGCSFQLRTFHCDFTWDQYLSAFLATQSRLADLYLADFREPEVATSSDAMALDLPTAAGISTSVFVPKLSILECTFSEAAVALIPERPVARVKTCFTHSKLEEKCVELRAMVGALKRSKRRLRALDMADSSYTADFSLELLSLLTTDAFFCGDLRYLGTLVFPVDGRKRLEFYGFLMRMSQLRCVEVDVSDWNPPPTHAAALRALTCELRLYCPSITTAVFVYEFERYLMKAVGGLVMYDEDAVTESLWREI